MNIENFAKEIERMDDRYLFKAKRLDNGEWVQGVPFEIEGKMVILVEDNENLLRVHYIEENMWNAEIYAIEVEPDTICQCTGLKDDNGNLIWENDILFLKDEINGCESGADTGDNGSRSKSRGNAGRFGLSGR